MVKEPAASLWAPLRSVMAHPPQTTGRERILPDMPYLSNVRDGRSDTCFTIGINRDQGTRD